MRNILHRVLILCTVSVILSCSTHEETACSLVTELIKDNFGVLFNAAGMETAECKAVELGKAIRSGYYHDAKAYLNNGKILRITVEIKWDSVYVQIPNESLFGDE